MADKWFVAVSSFFMAQVTANCTHTHTLTDKQKMSTFFFFLFLIFLPYVVLYILFYYYSKKKTEKKILDTFWHGDFEFTSITRQNQIEKGGFWKCSSVVFEGVRITTNRDSSIKRTPSTFDSPSFHVLMFSYSGFSFFPRNIKLIPGIMWAHINRVNNPLPRPVPEKEKYVYRPTTTVNALPIVSVFCVCTVFIFDLFAHFFYFFDRKFLFWWSFFGQHIFRSRFLLLSACVYNQCLENSKKKGRTVNRCVRIFSTRRIFQFYTRHYGLSRWANHKSGSHTKMAARVRYRPTLSGCVFSGLPFHLNRQPKNILSVPWCFSIAGGPPFADFARRSVTEVIE